ncbi:hypothetical protein HMPREF1545_03728 [Oscillibacter sp. KLE 1728]|nr:hypothetical protein HMPREF1545_03728 [Oscillibacter sp. KLE 1728]ERK67651.1 hypothetical protein HMPREF1546_00358 [Oscillibacter sp. KLE 1745]
MPTFHRCLSWYAPFCEKTAPCPPAGENRERKRLEIKDRVKS